MGVQICNCNKDNQNVPTTYTNIPIVDDNTINNRKHMNKYYSNIKSTPKNKNYVSSVKNTNANTANKDIFISKNNSSFFINISDVNKIFEYMVIIKEDEELKKIKSNVIKNFDNKIKEFAEYISDVKFNEIEKSIEKNNPNNFAVNENKNKNIFESNININIDNLKKCFIRPALMFTKDNSIYKGSWNFQGKKEGYGIFIDSKGNKYIGEWKDDKFHGKGRLISINGDFYEGDFLLGQIEGNGIYNSTKNGYHYIGEFKNNKFHGNGKLLFNDNTKYKGHFNEGYMEGEGNLLFNDGCFYTGDFSKNKYEGSGKFIFNNGRKYEGDWKNNAMHGFGVFTWEDFTKYKGEYKNNLRNGNGVYSFGANLYDGFWVNNLPHGEGVLLNEGLRIEGKFRYGKIVEAVNAKGANREIELKYSYRSTRRYMSESRKTLPKFDTMGPVNKKPIDKICKSCKSNKIKLNRKKSKSNNEIEFGMNDEDHKDSRKHKVKFKCVQNY